MLPLRVSILRPVSQTNDYGLPVLSWQSHLQNIPAKMEILDGDSGTASREKLRFKIHMPIETDIQQVDRVVVDQRQFQVLVVTNPAQTGHLKTALTMEVLP
jgi:head-tail adaptor